MLIKSRFLPRDNLLSLYTAGAISLCLAISVIYFANTVGSSDSLLMALKSLAVTYLPKLGLDLVILWPVVWIVRSITRSLRGTSTAEPITTRERYSPIIKV